MFARIVVGIDGRAHGRDALALATAVARRTGGALTLAYVIHRAPAFLPIEALEDEFRAEGEEFLSAASAEVPPGIDCRPRIVMDRSLARGIVELAEAESADLIVLGSAHRGAVGRVLVGNVGQQVLDGAPCAVAVAPAGLGDRGAPEVDVIGVGVDGEPESMAALRAAGELARAFGTTVRLITVILQSDLFVPHGSPPDVYDAIAGAARQHARQLIHDVSAALPADVGVESEIMDGPTPTSLEDAAGRVDLLVVGSRGFGPVRRVLLGSTSSHLVKASPCPVLVVPRTEDSQAEGDAAGSGARTAEATSAGG